MRLKLEGILVANVTPFGPDLALDEEGLRTHIRSLADTPGLGGIVCNGHAGEVACLTREERRRCIEIVAKEVKGRLPIVACFEAVATREAVEAACEARDAGADALMICPPPIYAWSPAGNPEFAVAYHQAIARGAGLPMILFQYPPQAAFSYSTECLLALAEEIEEVVAVKFADGGNIRRYESDLRALRALPRPIAVLYTSAREFFQHFLTGADGALTGFANFAPAECVALYQACRRGDLPAARALHEQLYPATSAVYRDPYVNLHTRYKEATFLCGRIRTPHVRPPQLPLREEERAALRAALRASRLLPE